MANQENYWSELAARLFAQQQFGRPLDKALRDLFWQWGQMDESTPEKQYWRSALGMARAGELDYLEPAVPATPTPPPNLPPVGPGGARTTPVTPTVTPPVTPTVTPVTPVQTPGTPSPPIPATPTTTPVAPTVTPVFTPEELAAIFISRTQGIPIEAARIALNTPAWAAIKTSLLAAAAAGSLDYLKTPAAGAANPLQDLIDALTKSNAAGQYSQLAQALITAATGLRGPRDYMKFVQSTSAGRTLLEQLYGDRPRPAFSAPTEPMEPLTLQDLINRLGLGGQPAPAQGQPEARSLPLPYQINPAVWDALGGVGQQLSLGMAEGQGWDPDEFLRQLNAARPQGSATGQTLFQYQSPRGFF